MRATILALGFALALLPPAGAQECVPTTSTTGLEQVVVGPAPFLALYVANDLCQPGCAFSTWVYAETNGIPGLQRGDEFRDDTCGGQIESDTLAS